MVRMPRTDTLVPASDGRVSWGLVWRVSAFLPMVLLCVALTVRALGGTSDAAPEAAADDTPTTSSSSTGTSPILTAAHRSKKQKAAKSPDSSPTSSPSTESTPASEEPTRTSSPSPSPTKTPSPTPTPDEAREQCLAEGRSLAELAECIADKMGG